ncbi:histidine ABC transporter permease HisQ [Robbsia sp. Bb-Pol-6]|uniref:Histidine ABC transporter permease HisQ n=1 Tax=Robbsia betulipollinis TaxID=2981849 RepID=A0ABT3ZM44_9BURK|nr:histidine ABC transporter permease HisQ [Robbsia betulipollinis]MCY0387609.1 histidine ABC transporter permease HisQ [Robbsia betulipollinis]
MFLYGYGPVILQGAWQTVQLAVLSLITAIVIGLIGASCKLSRNRAARALATVYTTLIRGVPDLVLMLLLFYGIQIWLNTLTDWMSLDQFNIDPFLAGVLTLGFIYGAYFTETFRGAFMAVPRGQQEAALAYGMKPFQTFRRILFPQMMRHALPGIGNNWQVIVKATALVSIIGLADLVKATQDAGKGSLDFFLFTLVAAGVYLGITTLSNLVLIFLERRYSVGVRKADL